MHGSKRDNRRRAHSPRHGPNRCAPCANPFGPAPPATRSSMTSWRAPWPASMRPVRRMRRLPPACRDPGVGARFRLPWPPRQRCWWSWPEWRCCRGPHRMAVRRVPTRRLRPRRPTRAETAPRRPPPPKCRRRAPCRSATTPRQAPGRPLHWKRSPPRPTTHCRRPARRTEHSRTSSTGRPTGIEHPNASR